MFSKLVEGTGSEAGKFTKADATLLEVALPTVPLADATSNMARGVLHGAIGWFAAKKKYTGNFLG